MHHQWHSTRSRRSKTRSTCIHIQSLWTRRYSVVVLRNSLDPSFLPHVNSNVYFKFSDTISTKLGLVAPVSQTVQEFPRSAGVPTSGTRVYFVPRIELGQHTYIVALLTVYDSYVVLHAAQKASDNWRVDGARHGKRGR